MEPEFDVTDEIMEFMEEMSEERAELLSIRCQRAIEELGEDADQEEQAEACIQEIKVMYLTDILQELQDQGLVEVTGISEDGELIYAARKPD